VTVIVNGEPRDLTAGATVSEVLGALGIEVRRGLAVAVDGEVVRRAEWDVRALPEGARVEVVRAVQGG
jgi:sulfur carrier protein